ncbi:MAG: hypothetical protein WKF31_02435 [Thermoleophilaceae bacterium]
MPRAAAPIEGGAAVRAAAPAGMAARRAPAAGAVPRPRPSSVPPRRRSAPPRRDGAPQRAHQPVAVPSRPLAALPSLPAARRASEEILDRLLRGHGWIVCIGVLLVGIVFLNVRLLELDGRIARDSDRVAALRQENGTLRLRSAHMGSSERIQRAAATRGLVWPAPGSMRYVRAGKRDATVAAGRIGPPRALAGTSGPAAQGQAAADGQTAQPGSAAPTEPAGTATGTGTGATTSATPASTPGAGAAPGSGE